MKAIRILKGDVSDRQFQKLRTLVPRAYAFEISPPVADLYWDPVLNAFGIVFETKHLIEIGRRLQQYGLFEEMRREGFPRSVLLKAQAMARKRAALTAYTAIAAHAS